MALKQLSVFLENRSGRIEEVFNVFSENDIHIRSFSLAESSDYGILRLIVSDPEKAKIQLKGKGFSASLTDVIGVKLEHGFNDLFRVAKVLPHVNIEYMYVLTTENEKQSIIFKIKETEEAERNLIAAGFALINETEN